MAQMPELRTIANGQSVDATDPQYNFQTIEEHLAAEVINRDGSVAMVEELTLSSSTPSDDLVAASKGYVDGIAVASNDYADGLTTSAKTAVFTRTTDISVASSGSGTVTFETESNDLDGWWSSGTTFTCPATGLYVISLRAEGTGASGFTETIVAIDPDGSLSSVGLNFVLLSGTGPSQGAVGAVAYLEAGESFVVDYLGNGSAAGTISDVVVTITKLA